MGHRLRWMEEVEADTQAQREDGEVEPDPGEESDPERGPQHLEDIHTLPPTSDSHQPRLKRTDLRRGKFQLAASGELPGH